MSKFNFEQWLRCHTISDDPDSYLVISTYHHDQVVISDIKNHWYRAVGVDLTAACHQYCQLVKDDLRACYGCQEMEKETAQKQANNSSN